MEANIENNTEKLDIVINVLKGLLEAWKEETQQNG
jgi:flagellin-specific chaperone FliS